MAVHKGRRRVTSGWCLFYVCVCVARSGRLLMSHTLQLQLLVSALLMMSDWCYHSRSFILFLPLFFSFFPPTGYQTNVTLLFNVMKIWFCTHKHTHLWKAVHVIHIQLQECEQHLFFLSCYFVWYFSFLVFFFFLNPPSLLSIIDL